MKNDIPFEPVQGVAVAIAPDDALLPADAQATWGVWLLNHNDYPLDNVLIVSEGYGERDGRAVTTSKLRYHYETVPAHTAVQVEPIDPALFALTNQFWVSYYQGRQIYDKKFVFVPGAVEEANLIPIQMLEGRRGVLHS